MTGVIIYACSSDKFESVISSNDIIDTIRPQLVKVSPAADKNSVSIYTNIEAHFNEPIKPESFTSSNFYVDGSVLCARSVEDSVLILNPVDSLEYGTTYTVYINSFICDTAGNYCGQNFNWSFTTLIDKFAPYLVSASPHDGQSEVDPNDDLTFVFSHPIDSATVNENTIQFTPSYSGRFTVDENEVIFSPDSGWGWNQEVQVYLSKDIKDVNGGVLATIYTISFTTLIDITPPDIVSTTPYDGQTDVESSDTLLIKFSEKIDTATVNQNTIQITPHYDGELIIDGNKIYFIPEGGWGWGQTVQVFISDDIADRAGNKMSQPYSFSFSSVFDITLPYVVSTSPYDGQSDVNMFDTLIIEFSEPIDSTTVNESTVQITPWPGGEFVIDQNIVYFLPDGWDFDQSVQVLVSSEIVDLSGNEMAESYSFSFHAFCELVPLSIGNYWIYGADTIKIVGDTLMDGQTWFKTNQGDYYFEDEDGFYVSNGESSCMRLKNPMYDWYGFIGCSAKDPYTTDYGNYLFYGDTTITINDVKFKCLRNYSYYYDENAGLWDWHFYERDYYVHPGVGMVYIIYTYYQSGLYAKRVCVSLTSFHIE